MTDPSSLLQVIDATLITVNVVYNDSATNITVEGAIESSDQSFLQSISWGITVVNATTATFTVVRQIFPKFRYLSDTTIPFLNLPRPQGTAITTPTTTLPRQQHQGHSR
jgi:hypothetical protein